MIQRLLDLALSQVGYFEKRSNAQLDNFTANAGANNYTKYARDYLAFADSNYQGQPWCAMFVSWLFNQLGFSLFPPFAYCPTGVNNFKLAGQWITKDPQKGDIIFFRDGTGIACHVGIVYDVDYANVYTVEGNTSSVAGVVANGGCVAKKGYPKGFAKILGYGRPNYSKGSEDEKMFEGLVAKYGQDKVLYAVESLIKAQLDESWKDDGASKLTTKYGLDVGVHASSDPITFGLMGAIMCKGE
ncbi:hypothetical protein FACS189425_09340 [Clostridia bacterium]|nr:hypothetical protein FACS189425_09340 [Clostridia bacterium]